MLEMTISDTTATVGVKTGKQNCMFNKLRLLQHNILFFYCEKWIRPIVRICNIKIHFVKYVFVVSQAITGGSMGLRRVLGVTWCLNGIPDNLRSFQKFQGFSGAF